MWLDLNLREGPRLLLGTPELDDTPPGWPSADTCTDIGSSPEERTRWPVLSPALRRTLPLLVGEERAALLTDLESGGGDLFAYGLPEENTSTARSSRQKIELSAWPLPPSLRQNRAEQSFESALLAASLVGEKVVLEEAVQRSNQLAAQKYTNEAKRLSRLLQKIKNDQSRLEKMAGKKQDALALQAELYRFPPAMKAASVTLLARQAPLDLDPRLTIRENMKALFHQSQRGERGLPVLLQRIQRLEQERADCLAHAAQCADLSTELAGTAPAPQNSKASVPPPAMPKNIQAFRSADGFLLLRGKDAEGNARLLKLSSPHDYWLHTGGAASAHVLIKRNHAKQEVPQQTLLQAGLLAALKSEVKENARAEIIAALARHIRPMKSPGRKKKPGNVRIEQILLNFDVALDGSVPSPEPII